MRLLYDNAQAIGRIIVEMNAPTFIALTTFLGVMVACCMGLALKLREVTRWRQLPPQYDRLDWYSYRVVAFGPAVFAISVALVPIAAICMAILFSTFVSWLTLGRDAPEDVPTDFVGAMNGFALFGAAVPFWAIYLLWKAHRRVRALSNTSERIAR